MENKKPKQKYERGWQKETIRIGNKHAKDFSYIGERRCLEAWRTLNNLKNVEYKKINIQGVPLNKRKLYFSKLLTEGRKDFFNGITEKKNYKNTVIKH